MKLKIGQWPLAVKLWGAFAALTLFIFGLLAILLPWTLKGFFTQQMYDILLDAQSGIQMEQNTLAIPAVRLDLKQLPPSMPLTQAVPMTKMPVSSQDEVTEKQLEPDKMAALTIATRISAPEGPSIQHVMINGNAQSAVTIAADPVTLPFVQAMEQDAFTQSAPVMKYTRSINNSSIFYVIRKEFVQNEPNYLISYASGSYRNDLVMTMFFRLMLLMVGLIVVSWLPCVGLARYFTRPLVQIERHVGKLAERDWHEPLETKRKDEIGRLAKAIESMRQRLVRQDKAQQFFLQHTSHELKTPVMVIRSYAQSILDGIFPKGSLNESLHVIIKEGERLEKRIRDLLLLNKLNYLTSRDKPFQPFELNAVIEDAVDRLRYRRPEIEWELELAPHLQVTGDAEQWKVAIENILDNQLRYAGSRIHIQAKLSERSATLPELIIANDGPPLDEAIAASLFEPFRTGGDGQFGLGLAIVKQIAEHHGMTVRAANEADGVAFYFEPGVN
ncbi:HAMP domain-containing sensor histidine kinase [Paenibacillus sp. 32352]|uniref:HAMP domain-containing sensor histidine kinase n=1 Tax=Paenibacillus sp. 32352 TaxID=1969111 RepID=UPI0009AF010F|nr:HAMP domain-containing sensor histidine kinase [Paenibacillus sp. 32352]